jgi:hypothetical protein
MHRYATAATTTVHPAIIPTDPLDTPANGRLSPR